MAGEPSGEQLLYSDQSFAEGRSRCVLAEVEGSVGRDLDPAKPRRPADSRAGRAAVRRAGARGGPRAQRRGPETQSDPGRPLRSVRRPDAFRLDPLAL